MSLILLLETSTDVCSVGLSKNGVIVYQETSDAPYSHTEKLTVLIQQVMAISGISINELDAVALSDGPGSYTSLRVGAATAKGLCYAIAIPLITLGSLDILACGVDSAMMKDDDFIISMIDARRMEVYTAVFDKNLHQILKPTPLILDNSSYQEYSNESNKLHLCGNGASKFYTGCNQEKFKLHHIQTSAGYMADRAFQLYQTGHFTDMAYFSPNYLKSPNITISSKNLFN